MCSIMSVGMSYFAVLLGPREHVIEDMASMSVGSMIYQSISRCSKVMEEGKRTASHLTLRFLHCKQA